MRDLVSNISIGTISITKTVDHQIPKTGTPEASRKPTISKMMISRITEQ